jgi:hypothetical protein
LWRTDGQWFTDMIALDQIILNTKHNNVSLQNKSLLWQYLSIRMKKIPAKRLQLIQKQ